MGKCQENPWKRGLEQFKNDCDRAAEISRENLKKLMTDNCETVYGKQYHFSKVEDEETYRKYVPLSEYADYEPYVFRMMEGERNVLTVYDVKHYIMTSGSTGVHKNIPLTKQALLRCENPIYYASYATTPEIEEGQILHLSVFRMEPPKEDKHTILSAAYFRHLHDRGCYALEDRYLGGKPFMFSKGIGLVPYAKLWLALCSPDMRAIQGFFLYDILLFLRYFEENWQMILEHIKKREIPKEIHLSEEVKEALLSFPLPSGEWLEYVEEQCKKGFQGIVKRIWKKAAWISGVGGNNFFAQEAVLKGYLGDIPIHYFSYAASECMIAIVTEPESVQNVLIPGTGYFEFIPYNKENDCHETRTIEELEIGQMYEIIITNFSGFYRYRLNDVVKITGFYGQSPILEVCFRKNQAVNIAGEKTDFQTIAMAMNELKKRTGLQIFEYSVCDDKTTLPGCYECFLEASEKKEGLEDLLDNILAEYNDDYRDLRELGMIGKLKLNFVKQGTHAECKLKYGKKQVQNKPMQHLTDLAVLSYMRERVLC